ncbi:MAG TPA: CpsD/CapB family tyrosine-protein kinase [Ramlibacter sp.]|nr:CpsD/CapB family tyrosine-protein kinase [Ramlibacter sp.]
MNDFNHHGEDRESDRAPADARQLVRRRGELAKEEPEQIVAYRHEHNLRVGEVAAELRSQQFHYPFNVYGTAVQSFGEELVAAREPFSDRAEEFRSLRGGLLSTVFSGAGKRALAVLSAEEGVGKTYMVSNLAVSFSQFAGQTLLIDANLRRPALHRVLGTKSDVGLSNLLAGEIQGAVVPVDGLEGLHFLGAGSAVADPVELLQGPRFSILLEQMVDTFDYIFVDTPSNDVGPDARLIAARAGAALLVGRKGHSRVALLRRLLSQLNMGPSFVAGVVLNEH